MTLFFSILVLVVTVVLTCWSVIAQPTNTKGKRGFVGLALVGALLSGVQIYLHYRDSEKEFMTVTGGTSFPFLSLQADSQGVHPTLLNGGEFPLYDLTVRLWDVADWTGRQRSPRETRQQVEQETIAVGTLPNGDFKLIPSLEPPTGDEVTYAAAFSARNGTWSQQSVLRSTPGGWKVASIIRRSRNVAKSAEETVGNAECHLVDADFPFKTDDSFRGWATFGHRCEPRAAE